MLATGSELVQRSGTTPSQQWVLELLLLARQYAIRDLEAVTLRYVSQRVRAGNASDVARWAAAHGVCELEQAARCCLALHSGGAGEGAAGVGRGRAVL